VRLKFSGYGSVGKGYPWRSFCDFDAAFITVTIARPFGEVVDVVDCVPDIGIEVLLGDLPASRVPSTECSVSLASIVDVRCFNLGFFFFLVAVFFVYMKVDFISGALSTLIYCALYFFSNYIWMQYKTAGQADVHFKIFLIQHIVCWILQFVGHGVFEKRNPALMDNLLLTLVAPDFVVLEIMFMFGYKREIHEGCNKEIVENIKVFHEGKAKKAT